MLRWLGLPVLLHILFVFFCGFGATPLQAKPAALYERLIQESAEELAHLHLLQDVDLSTGSLSLQAYDALLLGAETVSLTRYSGKYPSSDRSVNVQDLSLDGNWWLRLDSTWKLKKHSSTLTTIEIPTLDACTMRYSLKLTQEKASEKKRVLQLSSEEGVLCRYSFARESKDESFQLKEVQKTGEEPTIYSYQPHPVTKQPQVTTITQGGVVRAHYTYDAKGRVQEVWRPLGPTEKAVLALQCRYEELSEGTCVHCEDTEGARYIYYFSKNQQLTKIETFLDEAMLRTEQLVWQNNQLVEYSIQDAKKNAVGLRRFTYTEEGKCASTTLSGNLTGNVAHTFSIDFPEDAETITTTYMYDSEGRLIEKQQGECTYLFKYYGTSSLTTAEYTLKNGTPIKRSFTSYDKEGNCLRSIQDDGSSMDQNDLTGVTARTIISQTVYTGAKGKGLPQCIDALHLDIESGKEKLDHTWICLYDAQGHLIQRQECNEKGELFTAISYAYDAQGRLVVEEQLEGPTYTYVHSPRRLKIVCCQKSGSSSATYTYDCAGHLLSEEKESAAGSASSKYRYSPLGFCVEQEDALGNITTFQYDALGRKILEERPAILGLHDEACIPRLEWEYDLLDRPLRYVDPDGYTTTLACTLYGQPYCKKYPDGTIEEMSYSLLGVLLRTRDRTGQEKQAPPHTTFSHASADSLCTSSAPPFAPSIKREKVRNALGQWVYQDHRVEEGLVKTFTYDALHQLVMQEEQDIHGKNVRVHKKRYNASGKPIMEQWLHDKSSTAPYTIQRVYGPMGRLEKVIEGVATCREREMLYHYDKQGRLSCITKPNGCQIHYTYDLQGRIKTLHASDHTLSYAYHYDEKNNPITIDNLLDHTTLTRCYDNQGRLLEETLPSGHRFTYLYDLDGKLQELTLPDGSRTSYAYDVQGLQSIIRQDASGQKRYTQKLIRNPETGQLEGMELPQQLGELRYTRDSAGKRNGLSSPFFEQALAFSTDSPSTLASEQRKDSAGAYSTTYRHDAWQQLVEENSEVAEGDAAPQTQIYTYDALGNRIARNDKPSIFHANNDLEATPTTQYTYDQNGNRIRSEGPSGTTLYHYDALNRLICIEQPERARTTYSYDALHRRSKRATWTWHVTTQTWQPENQETFLYQGTLEVGTINQKGDTSLRILMPDVASESGATVAIELQGHLYVPVHDLHGSTTVLIDTETRRPVECYRRDAFGKEELYQITDASLYVPVDAAQAINPWRMEGKRHDAESGLVYYGQRFYDPSTGMWLTKDPLGLCDGPQDMLFVQNNPLHRTDLHGLFSLSKLWNTLTDYTSAAANSLHQTADNVLNFLFHDHHIINTLQRDLMFVRGMCGRLISEPILAACDFYTSQPHWGVYGNGELNDSIRFSYVNGIMNTQNGVFRTLQQLSVLHGGVNIHYTYRPTEGWTLDLLKAILVLKGYTSPTAISLVGLWRMLIEEMGGIEGEGTIIHYAHSLGSAETNSAQSILTPSEKRKLRIFTFGSPILIEDTGFGSVTNYVSRLDLVSLFDPHRYFAGLFGKKETNIVFIGNYWGIPLLDHYIDHRNYMHVLRGLGKFFTHGVHECH